MDAASGRRLRVVVADDHPLFLKAIAQLITDAHDLELAGRASSGDELVACVTKVDPDIVVTDLRMPGMNGIEAIKLMRLEDPQRRVLVLTMHDEEALVAAALRAGARGYTLKESPLSVVVSAIRAVGEGLLVLGPGVTAAPTTEGTPPAAFPELTPREREIVEQVAIGRTNLAIARVLNISEKTVRNSLSSVLAKLRLPDRSTLIDRARGAGLGHPQPP